MAESLSIEVGNLYLPHAQTTDIRGALGRYNNVYFRDTLIRLENEIRKTRVVENSSRAFRCGIIYINCI